MLQELRDTTYHTYITYILIIQSFLTQCLASNFWPFLSTKFFLQYNTAATKFQCPDVSYHTLHIDIQFDACLYNGFEHYLTVYIASGADIYVCQFVKSSWVLSRVCCLLLFRFKAASNAVQRLVGFGRFLAKESQARPPKPGKTGTVGRVITSLCVHFHVIHISITQHRTQTRKGEINRNPWDFTRLSEPVVGFLYISIVFLNPWPWGWKLDSSTFKPPADLWKKFAEAWAEQGGDVSMFFVKSPKFRWKCKNKFLLNCRFFSLWGLEALEELQAEDQADVNIPSRRLHLLAGTCFWLESCLDSMGHCHSSLA